MDKKQVVCQQEYPQFVATNASFSNFNTYKLSILSICFHNVSVFSILFEQYLYRVRILLAYHR